MCNFKNRITHTCSNVLIYALHHDKSYICSNIPGITDIKCIQNDKTDIKCITLFALCLTLDLVTIPHSRKSHGLRQNVTFFKVCKDSLCKKILREISCIMQSRFLNLFLTLLINIFFYLLQLFSSVFSKLNQPSLYLLCHTCPLFYFLLVSDTTEFHRSIR